MAAETTESFAAAYGRLRADPSFQFSFSAMPSAPRPPGWLLRWFKALDALLGGASPYVRIALWVALGAAVLSLVVVLWRQAGARAREKGASPLTLHALGEAANRAAARATARLGDADRLAASGRYGEAIHLLLLTGVDEVERARPGRIRPSFTSRDIAALTELPSEPRAAFARIATVVERALFGGRDVDAAAWSDCRGAYQALVRPQAWADMAAADTVT